MVIPKEVADKIKEGRNNVIVTEIESDFKRQFRELPKNIFIKDNFEFADNKEFLAFAYISSGVGTDRDDFTTEKILKKVWGIDASRKVKLKDPSSKLADPFSRVRVYTFRHLKPLEARGIIERHRKPKKRGRPLDYWRVNASSLTSIITYQRDFKHDDLHIELLKPKIEKLYQNIIIRKLLNPEYKKFKIKKDDTEKINWIQLLDEDWNIIPHYLTWHFNFPILFSMFCYLKSIKEQKIVPTGKFNIDLIFQMKDRDLLLKILPKIRITFNANEFIKPKGTVGSFNRIFSEEKKISNDKKTPLKFKEAFKELSELGEVFLNEYVTGQGETMLKQIGNIIDDLPNNPTQLKKIKKDETLIIYPSIYFSDQVKLTKIKK